MIYPSIDKLLEIVDSKYQLVHLVSKRSKQMHDNKQLQKKESEYRSKKNIGRALEELSDGLMHVKS
ncbi:MAG: DNA-directed RNA polymerase subunit omega [Bacilli bacterium]|nr:DNA-directed RNA polymerase subunit omega [Bacilli bacterium]